MSVRIGPVCSMLLLSALLLSAPLQAQSTSDVGSLGVEAGAVERTLAALQAQRGLGDNVALYLHSQAQDLVLLDVGVRIDEQAPRRYPYSNHEAALLQGGQYQHRLLQLRLQPGVHRLRADYVAREAGAKPGTPPLRGHIDSMISVSEHATAYTLQLDGGGWLRGPALMLRPAADADAHAAAHIAFLRAGGRTLQALREQARLPVAELGAPQSGVVPASPLAGTPTAATRYNAAIDAINNGHAAEGRALLAQLGRAEADDGPSWALRDLANLTLGYQAMRSGNDGVAIQALQQVRSPGPYSNPALLGLGWAWLLPSAAAEGGGLTQPLLRPRDADTTAIARRATPFRYADAVADGALADRLRSALVPWGELIGRDPTDPAVQEGLLAVAYAHAHIGAHEQAQRYYQRAVELYQNTHAHLGSALSAIEHGELTAGLITGTDDGGWGGWLPQLPEPRWWLTDPPNAPANFYLDLLLADDAARAALFDSREIWTLQRWLAEQAIDLALAAAPAEIRARNAALRHRAAAVAATRAQALERTAHATLEQRRRSTERYLAEARFALARMHDGPEGGMP